MKWMCKSINILYKYIWRSISFVVSFWIKWRKLSFFFLGIYSNKYSLNVKLLDITYCGKVIEFLFNKKLSSKKRPLTVIYVFFFWAAVELVVQNYNHKNAARRLQFSPGLLLLGIIFIFNLFFLIVLIHEWVKCTL